jgi:sulfopyruvate decarboxylase TPP-binding subunit
LFQTPLLLQEKGSGDEVQINDMKGLGNEVKMFPSLHHHLRLPDLLLAKHQPEIIQPAHQIRDI